MCFESFEFWLLDASRWVVAFSTACILTMGVDIDIYRQRVGTFYAHAQVCKVSRPKVSTTNCNDRWKQVNMHWHAEETDPPVQLNLSLSRARIGVMGVILHLSLTVMCIVKSKSPSTDLHDLSFKLKLANDIHVNPGPVFHNQHEMIPGAYCYSYHSPRQNQFYEASDRIPLNNSLWYNFESSEYSVLRRLDTLNDNLMTLQNHVKWMNDQYMQLQSILQNNDRRWQLYCDELTRRNVELQAEHDLMQKELQQIHSLDERPGLHSNVSRISKDMSRTKYSRISKHPKNYGQSQANPLSARFVTRKTSQICPDAQATSSQSGKARVQSDHGRDHGRHQTNNRRRTRRHRHRQRGRNETNLIAVVTEVTHSPSTAVESNAFGTVGKGDDRRTDLRLLGGKTTPSQRKPGSPMLLRQPDPHHTTTTPPRIDRPHSPEHSDTPLSAPPAPTQEARPEHRVQGPPQHQANAKSTGKVTKRRSKSQSTVLEWLQQDTGATAATSQEERFDNMSTESRGDVVNDDTRINENADREEDINAGDSRGTEREVGAWLGRLRQHAQTRPQITVQDTQPGST